jgi:hypothetical protein
MEMTEIERLPIWVRYTKKATDRKREQIERALQNAGARFAVHIGQPGSGPDAAPLIYSDIDWIEDDDGIWIAAQIPPQNAQRTVSELRACGCVAGIGKAELVF